ncbi:helix-turn-helix domain-containing protein [Streptomyces adustus]|uniref:Helix-turn-helix domain-containing protein n=2 Tax=Streptomyces adustus TaxID=1609272 RepID=A0A5N8VE81_9ACTN|nr:helix-turn-helix domain-containing protein [Streptomyces adustus]
MTASGGNMPRRTALSAEPNLHAEQLAEQLLRLKDHGELSMRQLAARTGYSQKSWERYLGGRSLPPRAAVEALARISDTDPVRLLALHEVATDTWNKGCTPTPSPSPSPSPSPEGPTRSEAQAVSDTSTPAAGTTPALSRSMRIAIGAGAVALVLAVSSTVLLALRVSADEGGPSAASSVPAAASGSAPNPVYTCRIQQIDGLWYAGISRTRNTELSYGNGGPEVAEAQCLLRRAGISPGGIDGMFGPLTQRAVRAMQKRSGLAADGMIGPLTWKALRG